jgi:hypothetical protein
MPIYVPGKLTLRQTWQPMDPDAAAYIAAVETADGQALEEKVKIAIDNFVLGCKADGIWNAIKASCILAGARTLNGALVPLVGTAPTNVSGLFVAGDYNRETGLKGDGSTKYLDSNRNNNADPQDSVHQCCFISTAPSAGVARIYMGAGVIDTGTTHLVRDSLGALSSRNRSSDFNSLVSALVTGFAGHSRSSSASYIIRANSTSYTESKTSETPFNGNVFVFATNPASFYSDARLAFYSIGESLDLARLDARVTDLINAIGVAIP